MIVFFRQSLKRFSICVKLSYFFLVRPFTFYLLEHKSEPLKVLYVKDIVYFT